MKKFLEEASRDKDLIGKVSKAETPEEIIALAAENGFTLTDDDLKREEPDGEVSDSELDAVAGGKACACVAGGGGEVGESSHGRDTLCYCVLAGSGSGTSYDGNYTFARCVCTWVGGGTTYT